LRSNPGLKLANAFVNPQLKLANAFGVNPRLELPTPAALIRG
jgi:hypothetical protein